MDHPVKATQFGFKVRQARISLKESQTQFGKRLRVHWTTIHRWESGKVVEGSLVYSELLEAIIARLRAEDRLVPDYYVNLAYQKDFEKRGNAVL